MATGRLDHTAGLLSFQEAIKTRFVLSVCFCPHHYFLSEPLLFLFLLRGRERESCFTGMISHRPVIPITIAFSVATGQMADQGQLF